MTPLTHDIVDRLHRSAMSLATLIGLDLLDTITEQRIATAAERLAGQLVGDDTRLAAQTATDLAHLLDDTIDDMASPLGVAVALTYETGEVGATTAAQLLGVARSRVYQLLDTGALDRGPDGGVSRASIARRITTQTHANTGS